MAGPFTSPNHVKLPVAVRGRPHVPRACIDIGSNTTRLLVAELESGRVREVLQQRAFTQVGRHTGADGRIAPEAVQRVAEVVAIQARVAAEMGAPGVCAVATAAIREAANHRELCRAVEDAAGVEVTILSAEEEARLAFVGATRTLDRPVAGDVAVVDVGGGSSEVVVGTIDDGVRWSTSLRLGSGMLTDAYVRSDPPGAAELHAMREHVAGALEGLEVPAAAHGLAVGGSASSLRRLTGALLEHETLERAVRILASRPTAEVGERFGIVPERVRLLPAGILVLEAISDRIGQPLRIAKGGLREGVVLDLLAGREPARVA